MYTSVDELKELLVGPGHVSEAQFDEVVKIAAAQKENVEDVLVDQDLIEEEQLGRLFADARGLPFVNLSTTGIDNEVFELIPELVARENGVIAFARSEQGVKVAMLDPDNLEIRNFIAKRVGAPVIAYVMARGDFKSVLKRYKAGLGNEFKKIFDDLKSESLSSEERDAVTILMVDTLVSYGYESQASDIHIEPHEEEVVIRFRIDGVMHDVLTMPKKYLDLILSRIKIMSRIRTDEHRAAQDGKFRFETNSGESADVRVSIVPVAHGENVVMRLLSAKNRQFSLSDLGLLDEDLAKVNKAIENPHGMILTTGPTGSGKTTTIYAILKILNTREVHVSTIEDPVEYDIGGISQIQVDKKTNLTFAEGLRAIVRQDPDIIMVGEIRDEETAGIATNSAMTGHLVLSTLHANDAATTLPRLLDMGIEPFLVASTVNVVMAQRLVRKICTNCRASASLTEEEKRAIERDTQIKQTFDRLGYGALDSLLVYRGEGCKVCNDTGYNGRLGIFEILEMSEAVKDLIVKRASSSEILTQAKNEGMKSMLEDGVNKVLSGITTVEEVLRVTKG